MGKVNHITEIIPDFDKLPDWAREAFEDGQYFAVVSEKVIEYEARLEAEEIEGNRSEDYLNSDDVIEVIRQLNLAKTTIKELETKLEVGRIAHSVEAKILDGIIDGQIATIKAIAEWVKAERDCCPAVNDAISDTRCQPYTNRGLRCPDCPATNVNELQAIINND